MWEITVPPRIFAYNFNEKGVDSYFPQSGIDEIRNVRDFRGPV